MELILIRHGLPIRRELETGRADPPLSDTGHEQAQKVGAWLQPEKIDALYASPMQRASQTAQPYAELTGHEIIHHEGIVEMDRDSSSYVPSEELKAQNYAAWQAMGRDFGETRSGKAFNATVIKALEGVVQKHKGQRIAAFCHGGVINMWAAHVLGLKPGFFFEAGYTSVNRFLCASSGERNILSLNETGHLR